MEKENIAILGGGLAGLSAAWFLSHPQNPNRDNYEITIYQQGWLLGGKCASVRNTTNAHGMRIEEHGIHVFGGCYYNTINMIDECYRELIDRNLRDSNHPIAKFEDAFKPQDYSGTWWSLWNGPSQLRFLRLTERRPNARKAADFASMPTALHWIWEFVRNLSREMRDFVEAEMGGEEPDWRPDFEADLADAELFYEQNAQKSPFVTKGPLSGLDDDIELIERVIVRLQQQEKILSQNQDPKSIILRNFIEFARVLLRGTVDDLLLKLKGFDSLDGEDFKDWFRRHGASASLLASPVMLSLPNILFAYPGGDTSNPPRMSAGAFLHWALRVGAYLGSYIYSFAAGTGEVVVAPLYLVLKSRGVKFELLHTVRKLTLTGDENSIDTIEIDVQAKPKVRDSSYDPVKTFPITRSAELEYWPEAPEFSDFANGDVLSNNVKDSVNLDSFWWDAAPAETKRLRKGEEFDHVVLAISLGALKHICGDIISAKRDWEQMVEGIETIQTQSAQLWFDRTTTEMGQTQPNTSPGVSGFTASATYDAPLSVHADLTHLLAVEPWATSPKGLLYFCGPRPDFGDEGDRSDTSYPAIARMATEHSVVTYLSSSCFPLLPKATVLAGNGSGDPRSLDCDLLHSPSGHTGVNRIKDQYVRANVNPSDRYVLSLPGTAQFRLKYDQSGIDNLTPAGDWTYTGLNVGCVEAAVVSGKLAASRISAWPAEADVIGYDSTPWA